jgi:carbamoyltransferase
VLILGINAYHADVSAVLLRDGQLVAALEEERFRRIKHWAGFPTEAIRRCLDIAGVDGRAVDHVAVSRDPRAHLFRKAAFAVRNRPNVRHVLDRMRNANKVRGIQAPLAAALDLPVGDTPPIHYVEHHPAHLASAYLVSPFPDAAICAIDAFGDFVSTSMAVGSGNHFEVLDRTYFPHSLGIFYSAVTQYLGFTGFGDEFKIMGLAPYGKARYVEQLRHLVRLRNGGRFELALEYFVHWNHGVAMEWNEGYPVVGPLYSRAIEQLLGPARQAGQPLTEREEDIAHSLQVVYEECAFHVLNGLWDRTKNPRLCLAGGCAMNSVANGKVRANTPFQDVYIQPAAGDNGTALGAAYYVWNQTLGKPRSFVMEHGYWGTEYASSDRAITLPSDERWRYESVSYADEDALCRTTAALIAAGNVVGWYQGRMEWGARALGNRSILADPRRSDIREIINLKIKFREKFRPFAPSILEERLDDYFVDGAPDPFMQQVYPVRPEARQTLPAITHVDGSGRLQTVSQVTNPRYYRLIKSFEALTGVGVVLNTSFNENEPIVDTPQQAIDCFLRTAMDVLVLNETIIRRVPLDVTLNAPPAGASSTL